MEGEITMAHKITNDCIVCGGCQSVCPCEAISEGDGKSKLLPTFCVDCGACAAQCPCRRYRRSLISKAYKLRNTALCLRFCLSRLR